MISTLMMFLAGIIVIIIIYFLESKNSDKRMEIMYDDVRKGKLKKMSKAEKQELKRYMKNLGNVDRKKIMKELLKIYDKEELREIF